jgi:DNA-binding NarL/FixJ family response regulator
MTNQLPSVLIINKQEQLRGSLRVLLTSLSRIGSVKVASDVSSKLVEVGDTPPALVLLALDSSYADAETLVTFHQIKSTWPGARTVVLVEDERQYQAVQTAGADSVLFNGLRAAELLKKIEWLLQRADQ